MRVIKIMLILMLLISVFILFSCAGEVEKGGPQLGADTILYNGKIVTVDENFSIAQAVAILGDKIIKVGENDDVRALAGPDTKEIDLKGKMVTLGFIDGHPHLVHRGTGLETTIDLAGVNSIEEIKGRIAKAVAARREGEWIITTWMRGQPFSELPDAFKEKRYPNRWDLDEVAPDNPVYIPTPFSYPNPMIVNSAALTLLGIKDDTPEKHRGATILRDPDKGVPNGQLHGMHIFNWNPYFNTLMNILPKYPPAVRTKGVKTQMRKGNSDGITTIYEGHYTSDDLLLILKNMREKDELTMRVSYSYQLPWGSMKQTEELMKSLAYATGKGVGDDMFKISGITTGVGGGPVNFGLGVMNKPYFDAYGNPNVKKTANPSQLKKIALLAAKYNLRLSIGMGGETGADVSLSVLDEVNNEIPISDKRWILMHIPYASKDNVAMAKKLGVAITTSNCFEYNEYAKGMEDFKRAFRENAEYYSSIFIPWRWWFDAGVIAALGSDNKEPRPMFTIWHALTRISRYGQNLMTPSKKITREDAIKLHTINGAKLLFWEDKVGSIEEGKLADLVVLEKDILTCPVDDIKDTKVLMTMLGGKVVHGDI